MYPLECNGHIATIQYLEAENPRREEPKPRPGPYQGNLRNRLGREKWVAYLRAARHIQHNEPADMEPQGMVPFGQYPRHPSRPQK